MNDSGKYLEHSFGGIILVRLSDSTRIYNFYPRGTYKCSIECRFYAYLMSGDTASSTCAELPGATESPRILVDSACPFGFGRLWRKNMLECYWKSRKKDFSRDKTEG